MEKLCLIEKGIGKDFISDLTTNLIKEYLLTYTHTFMRGSHCRRTVVSRVRFNYATETWENAQFELPFVDSDYVLLTPKDMLTKDDTWISHAD